MNLTSKRSIALIILLGAVTAFDAMAIDFYMPAFLVIQSSLNTNAATLQMSLSVFLIGLAAGQAIFGALIDSYGRRVPMLAGIIIFAAASAVLALSESISVFLVARFLQGIGGAAGVVTPRAIVTDVYKASDSTKAYIILMQITAIAPIIAPPAGGFIVNAFSWQFIFWILAVVGVLSIVATMLILPETLPKTNRVKFTPRGILRSYVDLLKNRQFMGFMMASVFLIASLFTYISGSPFMLMEYLGFSPNKYSVTFSLIALSMIIMGQVSILLLKRCTIEKLYSIGFLIHIVFVFAFAATVFMLPNNATILILTLGLAISSISLVMGALTSQAMSYVDATQRGTASAFLGVLQYVFGGVTGIVLGFAHNGTLVPLALIIFVCSLAAIFSWWFAQNNLRASETAQVI